MIIVKKFVLGGAALLLLIPLFRDPSASQGKPDGYVGSEKCATCHKGPRALWANSLHSKMYQRSDKAGAILGDFTGNDPARPFEKEDVAYTIGSRWEQMYVTLRGGEEYLLPAKWLIAQKKWSPLDETHRRNEPISKNCHGCHTTAWNPQQKTFAEMNIGCEACHGPGADHAAQPRKAKVLKSQNPEICGQCHTRGKSKDGLDYVVKFDPAKDRLSDMMSFTAPARENTRSWWSNRIERDRHQEFLGHMQSGHARSLERLRERARQHPSEVTAECFTCHSSEYHMAKDRGRVDTAALRHGVTCIQCHDPHGHAGERRPESGFAYGSTPCLSCHFVPGVKGHKTKAHHYPCPEKAATCVDCHMPVTGMSASTFNIRSHTMRVIPPEEAQKLGMPSSCNNGSCHAGKDFLWLRKSYSAFYANHSFFSGERR